MSEFDVYRTPDGALLLDCQSDALRHLNTRVVVPLLPIDNAPAAAARLNPIFDIEGERVMMATQFTAAMEIRQLGRMVADLSGARLDIIGALDMLVTGV